MKASTQGLVPDELTTQESPFEDKSNCCCRIAYFPLSKMTICGHWRVSLGLPIAISFFVLAFHGVFVFDTYNKFPKPWLMILAYSVTGLALLCLAISYVSLIAVGPGYIPYNWAQTRKKRYDWNYEMMHVVQFRNQFKWAKERAERPPRSVFASSALRIVLRADHFCVWARSWIGIKNYRYFVLMCFWVCAYCLANLGFRYWFFLSLARKPFPVRAVGGLVSVAGLLYLFVLAFFHMCQALHYTRKNQTLIEVWGKRATNLYDRGCCTNYEEVCGTRWCCLCWLNPCCRFRPKEDGFYDEVMLCESDPSSITQFSESMSTANV